jgi:hypothetical protein
MDKIKRLQESISELDINNLSVNKIETIICDFGLVYDLGCDYGEFQHYMVATRSELAVYQTPRQFAECIFELLKHEINTYIEIGIFSGGSYVIMTSFLKWKNPNIECVGVDITEKYLAPELKGNLKGFFRGTSESFRNKKFDLAFIDGDHRYRGIVIDWENVGKNAKMAMFHDINQPTWPDAKRHWDEIKDGKKYMEFIYHTENKPVHGIGLIFNG